MRLRHYGVLANRCKASTVPLCRQALGQAAPPPPPEPKSVAQWMQTWGPNIVIPPDNKYGADNSVYVARILWDQPNASWNKR